MYRGSVYEAEVEGTMVRLVPGRPCARIRALLQSRSARTAIYITAWNPMGRSQSRTTNVRVNCKLESDLHKLTKHIWYGAGRSRDGSWEEESFLALGISLRESKRLARKYRQVAIVWVGRTGIPRIVLTLRRGR